jgi:hypothetical protein
MSRNGQRRPARPRIEVRQSSASAEEAAAIAAAIEQFLRDTAPPPAAPPRPTGWARAARLEGVGFEPGGLGSWGDPEPWGG